MDLYQNIVLQLRRSKTPCAAATGCQGQKTAVRKDILIDDAVYKSPTIDDILADLQHNVEQTFEVFKQLDGYIPALKVSSRRDLLQTPRIETRASVASPISYPEDEPLSNSVVRLPLASAPAGIDAGHKPGTVDCGADAAQYYPSPTGDPFSQQLSQAMQQVRKSSSRLTSYVYQRDRPKEKPEERAIAQEPRAGNRFIKSFAQQTILPPKLDAVARQRGTTIVGPLAQNTPWQESVRRRLDNLQRSCVITPFIPATDLEYTEFYKHAFSSKEANITMYTVVQASRLLLRSTDSLFQDLKKLTVERLKSVNAGYGNVAKQPRLTRLMWKFCSEHGLTFRVYQLDVARLFSQMKQILVASFSEYGGKLADFLSCQLEMDYDVVGICVLVLFAQD